MNSLLGYDNIWQYLSSKYLKILKTTQKVSFDKVTVGHLQNIFMEHEIYLIS